MSHSYSHPRRHFSPSCSVSDILRALGHLVKPRNIIKHPTLHGHVNEPLRKRSKSFYYRFEPPLPLRHMSLYTGRSVTLNFASLSRPKGLVWSSRLLSRPTFTIFCRTTDAFSFRLSVITVYIPSSVDHLILNLTQTASSTRCVRVKRSRHGRLEGRMADDTGAPDDVAYTEYYISWSTNAQALQSITFTRSSSSYPSSTHHEVLHHPRSPCSQRAPLYGVGCHPRIRHYLR